MHKYAVSPTICGTVQGLSESRLREDPFDNRTPTRRSGVAARLRTDWLTALRTDDLSSHRPRTHRRGKRAESAGVWDLVQPHLSGRAAHQSATAAGTALSRSVRSSARVTITCPGAGPVIAPQALLMVSLVARCLLACPVPTVSARHWPAFGCAGRCGKLQRALLIRGLGFKSLAAQPSFKPLTWAFSLIPRSCRVARGACLLDVCSSAVILVMGRDLGPAVA